MQAVFRSPLLRTLREQGTWSILCPVLFLLAFSARPSCGQEYSASEWLKESVQNEMPASDILSLLNRTLARGARSDIKPHLPYSLRQGLYLTVIPALRM